MAANQHAYRANSRHDIKRVCNNSTPAVCPKAVGILLTILWSSEIPHFILDGSVSKHAHVWTPLSFRLLYIPPPLTWHMMGQAYTWLTCTVCQIQVHYGIITGIIYNTPQPQNTSLILIASQRESNYNRILIKPIKEFIYLLIPKQTDNFNQYHCYAPLLFQNLLKRYNSPK